MAENAVLVVFAGRPGTGKTTVARGLAQQLRATYVRIDAIETAVVRCGLSEVPVGPVGYVVAHELAAANLALGTSVVVDAVNPVPEARAGWRPLSRVARLVIFETVIPDVGEHRLRVTMRQPDLLDQVVPTWADVEASEYEAWDTQRDGRRHRLETTDTEQAFAQALHIVLERP